MRAVGHWADDKPGSHGPSPHHADSVASGGKHSDEKSEKKTAEFKPVIKGKYLQLSETDETVVGLNFHGKWMVTLSGGKPVPLSSAKLGSLQGAKSGSILEMHAAVLADGAWALGDAAEGMLVTGDGASASVLGQIAVKDSSGWHLHGKHGAKDSLPPDLATAIREDDMVELNGVRGPFAWMSFPEKKEKENPSGWAHTSHTKKDLAGSRSDLEDASNKLPESLRNEVAPHLDLMATVSLVEGSYSATSGAIGDTSGSLGIFQWARSRDPKEGADSLDRFFEHMQKRAKAGAEKQKHKEKPSADEEIAMRAWAEVEARGIGIDSGHTTIKHGAQSRRAGGLDLELAMAGSTGPEDSYRLTHSLQDSSNLKSRLGSIVNAKENHSKTDEEKKKLEIQYLDGLILQMRTACKDVLDSDLVKDESGKDSPAKSEIEKTAAKLEPKKETPGKESQGTKQVSPAANPAPETRPKESSPSTVANSDGHAVSTQDKNAKEPHPANPAQALAALDDQIKERSSLIQMADSVLRPLLNRKIREAPGMATDDMKQYQLVAALDTIKELKARAIRPSIDDYFHGLFPGSEVSPDSLNLNVEGRRLHLKSLRVSHVGDVLKSEKALTEMAMLGVNRPAYVETALWKALQPADPVSEATQLAQTIFAGLDKLEEAKRAAADKAKAAKLGDDKKSVAAKKASPHVKKSDYSESDLRELLASPPPELSAEATAVGNALDSLRAIFWPQGSKIDEETLLTQFRQEAMRVYNTREQGDANDHNRVGRFVTVDLVDWKAIDAVKTKS